MSDQNTILPDILTDETKIFILSAVTHTTKSLIDTIFYDNVTSKISGNEATSISDHLTQFHKIKQKRSFCNFAPKALLGITFFSFLLGTQIYIFNSSFAKLKAYWIQVPS